MATFTALDVLELTTRLGEAGLLPPRAATDHFALRGIPQGSVNSNYRVDLADQALFVRIYEEQSHEGAEREARLLRHLAARALPTPAPIPWSASDPTKVITTLSGKPAALFPWIAGEMRCQASLTPELTERVGVALAEIHRAGEGAEYGHGRFRPEDLAARLPTIAGAEDADLAAQARPLAERLARVQARRDPGLPRGLVHGDLFRDNVLWGASGRIVALLDFESASEGVFAYDLAVTVLAWCYGDAFDGALARALVAGYQSVRPLTPAERDGFLAEAVLAALRFTVTRITDYAMPREAVSGDGSAGAPRVTKDWRRFDARARHLEGLLDAGRKVSWV